jgi:hypothetical protein
MLADMYMFRRKELAADAMNKKTGHRFLVKISETCYVIFGKRYSPAYYGGRLIQEFPA